MQKKTRDFLNKKKAKTKIGSDCCLSPHFCSCLLTQNNLGSSLFLHMSAMFVLLNGH